MTVLDAVIHLVNFALPAVFVGGALAFVYRKKNNQSVRRVWLVNSLVGIAAMIAGLILFGVDGKMLSYALLIVASSLSQLWQSRKN